MNHDRLLIIGLLAGATSLLSSCSDPVRPGGYIPATITIDTVSVSSLPIHMDFMVFYFRETYEWPGFGIDYTRADSLANWLDSRGFRPTDMWIPAEPPVCLIPFRTWNYIYVLLENPNAYIHVEGFQQATSFNECFWSWRHYKYIRNHGGA